MHVRRRNVFAHSLMLTAVIGTIACGGGKPKAGTVLDEAMLAKRTVDSFPAADEDYFHDMDGGVELTKEQIQGRNMWIVWTGGNDRLWDVLSRESFGSLDFLKTVSSHPTLPYSRDTRWTYLGLVNEPCFTKATGPDPNRYGLWLDVRDPKCKPIPSRTRRSTRAFRLALAARPCPSARTTAKPPASSDCDSSPTRTSTRRHGESGTLNATTAISPITSNATS
jgi:hypothetical protein